jgi:hypothetical protein
MIDVYNGNNFDGDNDNNDTSKINCIDDNYPKADNNDDNDDDDNDDDDNDDNDGDDNDDNDGDDNDDSDDNDDDDIDDNDVGASRHLKGMIDVYNGHYKSIYIYIYVYLHINMYIYLYTNI